MCVRKISIVVGMLFAIIAISAGCANPYSNDAYTVTLPVITDVQQTASQAHNDPITPQIMLDDGVYHYVGYIDSSIRYDENSYTGRITSIVPASESPTINGQANFDAEDAPYVNKFGKISLLWDDKWALFLTQADILHNEALINAPRTAPKLYVALEAADRAQTAEALQLTTGWSIMYDQVNGFGYFTDSSGPLSTLPEQTAASTIMVDGENCILKLQFTDDYLPEVVYIKRWNVEQVENMQDFDSVYLSGEPVPVDDFTFRISNDGHSYIYEVHAKWLPGYSYFAFMTSAAYINLT